LKQTRPDQIRSERLDEQALAYLKEKRSTSVEELYDTLKAATPSVTKAEIADAVWRLVRREEVEVEDDPPAAKSLREYLGFWERNTSLYIVLAVSHAMLFLVYVVSPSSPLVVLRWVLGFAFVLFLPGYLAIEALFPKGRELDSLERLAFSVGLSLALVPLIGLFLNYSPWGLRLDPIIISLTILTIGLAVVALVRRFRLSVERFDLQHLS